MNSPDRAERTRHPRRRRATRSTPKTFSTAPRQRVAHGFLPIAHDGAPTAFSEFPLDPRLLQGIDDRGFVSTTPIQSAAIPIVLRGEDVIGCAQTGTGKTAAFLLPIAHRLLTTRPGGIAPSTRALVLAPTRELAVQIEEDFQGLAYHAPLTGVAVYGGVDAGPQERALRAGVDLVVATPGRLLDHMGSASTRFANLEVLVLDEADRMLDMGFWPSVRRIVSTLPSDRQTLFFSATMSEDVFRSAIEIMRDPKMVEIRTGNAARGLTETVTHHAHRVPSADKVDWVARFLRGTDEPTLIFTRTKRGADRLARRLRAGGIRCAALHADRSQDERTAAVQGFKAGRFTTLVATDIAARGIDIDGIGHVINFEVPDSAEAYVHRVGRTGRAEALGNALTLIAPEEAHAFRALEHALNITLADTPGGKS